jgi:hypothetical protein
MKYKLRIPPNKLREYQQKYNYESEEKLEKFHGISERQGHITVSQLHEICRWKSKRRAELAKNNPPSLVKELTGFSFSAKNETSRLGALTLLEGVHFPTASVILHFCLDQAYPILDVRALWSLSIEKPSQYTFDFWESYVGVCREVAAQNALSVRHLDMALWQYSRLHQKNT